MIDDLQFVVDSLRKTEPLQDGENDGENVSDVVAAPKTERQTSNGVERRLLETLAVNRCPAVTKSPQSCRV
jgi:hypothetical protein